jgi:acyl carrier protein
MTTSSRTPEGVPGRCPVCAAIICLELSGPDGDAPCPYCDSPLWYLRMLDDVRYYAHDEVPPVTREKILAFLSQWLHRGEMRYETARRRWLDVDSLDLFEIVLRLEREFGVDIPQREAMKWRSIGDLIDFLVDNCPH